MEKKQKTIVTKVIIANKPLPKNIIEAIEKKQAWKENVRSRTPEPINKSNRFL